MFGSGNWLTPGISLVQFKAIQSVVLLAVCALCTVCVLETNKLAWSYLAGFRPLMLAVCV
ncbi:DMT family protein [Hymenobacter sp. UYP22]|uniref:DMT family protein n=1 Tax=Hymenobacter sp. UYP22 TaxID=3156348 RepID=UPI0033940F9A